MSVAPDHDVCDTANDKPNIIFLSGCILIFTEALLNFFSEYLLSILPWCVSFGQAVALDPINDQSVIKIRKRQAYVYAKGRCRRNWLHWSIRDVQKGKY